MEQPKKKVMKVGIDPGVKGGIAFVGEDIIHLYDLPLCDQVWSKPKKGKQPQMVDSIQLVRLISYYRSEYEIEMVTIEIVHSMPKQGVASSFKFGQAFGTLLTIPPILGLNSKLVLPQTWKKKFGLINKDKDAARLLALEKYPILEKFLVPVRNKFTKSQAQDRADAFFIAKT